MPRYRPVTYREHWEHPSRAKRHEFQMVPVNIQSAFSYVLLLAGAERGDDSKVQRGRGHGPTQGANGNRFGLLICMGISLSPTTHPRK